MPRVDTRPAPTLDRVGRVRRAQRYILPHLPDPRPSSDNDTRTGMAGSAVEGWRDASRSVRGIPRRGLKPTLPPRPIIPRDARPPLPCAGPFAERGGGRRAAGGAAAGDGGGAAAGLEALLKRGTVRGLGGILALYERLPDSLQLAVLQNVKSLHQRLRESGRGDLTAQRLAAMKLIALGRQGKLAYVLSENLHGGDDALGRAAAEAMVDARPVGGDRDAGAATGERGDDLASPADDERTRGRPTTDRRLERRRVISLDRPCGAGLPRADGAAAGDRGGGGPGDGCAPRKARAGAAAGGAAAVRLAGQQDAGDPARRPSTAGRARWSAGCSSRRPASTSRRSCWAPATGELRSHFGVGFSHIDEVAGAGRAAAQDALAEGPPAAALHAPGDRGAWWGEAELASDIERRAAEDAARIGEWLAASGMHDVDAGRADGTASRCTRKDDLRCAAAAAADRGAAAARGRRSQLLQDLPDRPGRAAGPHGGPRDRPPPARRFREHAAAAHDRRAGVGPAGDQPGDRAGGVRAFLAAVRPPRQARPASRPACAMLKLLPDGAAAPRAAAGRRAGRAAAQGDADGAGTRPGRAAARPDRSALQPTPTRGSAARPSPASWATWDRAGPSVLVERLLNDADARVRANTIEVLEARGDRRVPADARPARPRAGHQPRARQRDQGAAHACGLISVGPLLMAMLRDDRARAPHLGAVGAAADRLVAAARRGRPPGQAGQQPPRPPLRPGRAPGRRRIGRGGERAGESWIKP